MEQGNASFLKIEPKSFWLIFLLISVNLFSISVFGRDNVLLRYARQPFLGVLLAWIFHAFPQTGKPKQGFSQMVVFFGFGLFYLIFNILTSINISNSITYGLWMVLSFIFLYQWLVLRNPLPFLQLLFQIAAACGLLGILIISASYIGGYVLGIEIFFDERFNYTLGSMTTEFGGIFGSNNSFGIITFLTFSFLLLLSILHGTGFFSTLFLGLAVGLSVLLFFIGNRASMACSVILWLFYLLWVKRSFLGVFLLFVCMASAVILFPDEVQKRLRLEQFQGGNVLGNRSQLVEEAMMVISDMNFFGVGYHNQRDSRKYYQVVDESDINLNFHNTYLAVLAELGWAGLLWIPGLVLVALMKSVFFRRTGTVKDSALRHIISLLFIVLMVYLPVEDSINSPGSPTFLFFWILFFALIIGANEEEIPVRTEPESTHAIEDRLPHHTV